MLLLRRRRLPLLLLTPHGAAAARAHRRAARGHQPHTLRTTLKQLCVMQLSDDLGTRIQRSS